MPGAEVKLTSLRKGFLGSLGYSDLKSQFLFLTWKREEFLMIIEQFLLLKYDTVVGKFKTNQSETA